MREPLHGWLLRLSPAFVFTVIYDCVWLEEIRERIMTKTDEVWCLGSVEDAYKCRGSSKAVVDDKKNRCRHVDKFNIVVDNMSSRHHFTKFMLNTYLDEVEFC